LKNIDVARALKDKSYRAGLPVETQRALQTLLDESGLSEQDLEKVSGSGFIMRDTVIIPRR
jgi:antitoxin component HigA of HigAB toxin-antitoxin module